MIEASLVDLSDLCALPGNPKAHDQPSIAASVGAYGFLERIVINRTTGHILSGHGRTEMLAGAKAAGEEPPVNVEARGDRWFVPVDYVEVEERLEPAEALALNRTVELGGWDDHALAAMLADLQAVEVPIIGWPDEDVDRMTGAALNLEPPAVDEPQGGVAMRAFRFSIPEDDAPVVDHAFAALRGGHRDLSDDQLFVALCHKVR